MLSNPFNFDNYDGPLFYLTSIAFASLGTSVGVQTTIRMQQEVGARTEFESMFLYTFASILALVFTLLSALLFFALLYELFTDTPDNPTDPTSGS